MQSVNATVLGNNLGAIEVGRRSVAIFRDNPADKLVALSIVDLSKRYGPQMIGEGEIFEPLGPQRSGEDHHHNDAPYAAAILWGRCEALRSERVERILISSAKLIVIATQEICPYPNREPIVPSTLDSQPIATSGNFTKGEPNDEWGARGETGSRFEQTQRRTGSGEYSNFSWIGAWVELFHRPHVFCFLHGVSCSASMISSSFFPSLPQ
jgi:hypothetical protein